MPLLNTVQPEKAGGKVKEIYTVFENMNIPVPMPLQMMSVSPDLLAIQSGYINYVMNHSALKPSLQAHIRLMVANEENFTYCINFNEQLLKEYVGLNDDQIAAAGKDPGEAALDPEEIALLLFVQKILRDPAQTQQDDMEKLKSLGWSERDIFDATYIGMNLFAIGLMFKAFKIGEQ